VASSSRRVKDMYIRIYLVHSRIGTYTFVFSKYILLDLILCSIVGVMEDLWHTLNADK